MIYKKRRGYHAWRFKTSWGIFRISWAAPGTCWHGHGFTPKGRLLRHDYLVGFQRTLMRSLHEYVYIMHLGKLMVAWWHFSKRTR